MNSKTIIPADFRNFGVRCFRSIGVATPVARTILDALIETSLRGVDSHGLRLLPHYVNAVRLGRINPQARYAFKNTSPTTGIVDAKDGYGIMATRLAMDEAITMAKTQGNGAVSIKNSSHFGAAALYTTQAARKGCIGLAVTHVESVVLPFHGKKPYLGTNAMSIAAPIEGENPICMDMATSAMTFNKLLMAKAQGFPLEPGSAANAEGASVTDPALAAFLLHFGGYKGYSLAFMVEMFSSLLSGMPFGTHIQPMYPLTGQKRKLGHFVWALDISRFVPLRVFKQRMKQLATELRSTPAITGQTVMVPGDPEKKAFEHRSKTGIPVALPDWEAIQKLATELKIPIKMSS